MATPTEINFVDNSFVHWEAGAPYPDPNNPVLSIRDLQAVVIGGGGGGLNWLGTWNSGTTYNTDDAITYNGSSYVCVLSNTNTAPPNATYWQVLATYLPPSRTTTAKTTGTLATSVAETGSIALAKSGYLLTVQVSCKCRVQLYSTAAARDAALEVIRPWGTVPVIFTEHEVIADVQVAAAGTTFPFTWIMSPPALLCNGDGPTTNLIYYRITNLDSSQAVTVTFGYVNLET